MSAKKSVKMALLVSASTCVCGAAISENLVTNALSFYGTPGLIETPTAETAEDGALIASYTQFGSTTRTALTFQLTKRLTASFRYSKVPDFETIGVDYFDRSFDLRFQVFDEQKYLPGISVGLRDFAGTGVLGSEYIVATKTIGEKLRVSAGLGWGRLGTYNDLGSPFGERPTDQLLTGGTANFDKFFKGPVAPFGGISYQATDRLTLKAEYSSDNYVIETERGLFERNSPWNFGVDYRFKNGVGVSAAYLYGSEFGVQVNLALSPKRPIVPLGNEKAPLPVERRPSRSTAPDDWGVEWASEARATPVLSERLSKVLEKDGIVVEAISVSGTQVELRVRNNRYQALPQALGRSARAMTRALPASVETIAITPVESGVPLSRVVFRRTDLENFENAASKEILARASIEDAARSPANLTQVPGIYPRFDWSLTPYVNLGYFDPDAPVRGDFGLRLSADYKIAPGWELSGSIRKKIAGNLDEVERESNSVLPRVRSDFALYAREADPALDHLTLAHYGRPGKDLYSRVTVGYLEKMFGGVSGEILWKPVNSRLALGAEVNWVKQRDFDQLLAFRDYEVVTGHASAYYSFGNGFHGQVDVGRYLAGDWGATISLDREFANGWSVGAFATFTDVSFEDFGEGSFDKGIRLKVPISFFTGQPSKKRLASTIRPLTRDGGARLRVDGRLYERVRVAHEPDLAKSWGNFWR